MDVRLFDQSVYESPFICNVGDPDLVTVRDMPQYLSYDSLNREHSFESNEFFLLSNNKKQQLFITYKFLFCQIHLTFFK